MLFHIKRRTWCLGGQHVYALLPSGLGKNFAKPCSAFWLSTVQWQTAYCCYLANLAVNETWLVQFECDRQGLFSHFSSFASSLIRFPWILTWMCTGEKFEVFRKHFSCDASYFFVLFFSLTFSNLELGNVINLTPTYANFAAKTLNLQ